MCVVSFSESPATRALCSRTRATAVRSNGRWLSRRTSVAISRAYSRQFSGAAVHLFLEVGRHLEQLGEIAVVLMQQVVQHPVAQQHHLDVQRDRLRLQRHGAEQAERFRPAIRS